MMVENMTESMSTTKNKDTESLPGLMAESTKAAGTTASSTAKVFITLQREKSSKANGTMEKELDGSTRTSDLLGSPYLIKLYIVCNILSSIN